MNFSNDKAIYVQIAERLSDEILAGKYKEDERIPSVREYAVLLEVNANTTVKAYDLLATDEIIYNKPDRFDVISGDDALTFSMVASGAAGVISVIGNALPREFSRMIRLEFKGEYEPARKIHHMFTELYSLLFVDGNPAGVKALLNDMGFIENQLRLPLVPTKIETKQKMADILERLRL